MVRIRPQVQGIRRYEAGRDMDAVMREYGLESIIKLASNECPYPPFEPVLEAIGSRIGDLNRYPDNDYFAIRSALATHLGVDRDSVWVGAGSSEVLRTMALAVGGPGTSAVFAWPSFAMYPIATDVAGAEPIPVPLDANAAHDLDAMRDAVRADTTIVYLCNPNNPSGTICGSDDVEAFVRALPDTVLVVIDEAYGEYATDPRFGPALELAMELPNVVWTRTFSKVYGLAGLRVGYAVGRSETMAEISKPQAPFVVSALAEAAAVEALKHQDLVAARVVENDAERSRLEAAFADRGIPYAPSQANFVMTGPFGDGRGIVERLLTRGIITRPIGPAHVRVTVGTPDENRRLLEELGVFVD